MKQLLTGIRTRIARKTRSLWPAWEEKALLIAIEREPRHATHYLRLAEIYRSRAVKLLEQSRNLCERARGHNADSFEVNSQLSVALLYAGHPVDAFGYARKALAIRPTEKWLWEFLYHIAGKSHGLTSVLVVLDEGRKQHPEVDFFREDGFLRMQQDAIANKLPAILLNTQAKSGTIYLRGKLSEALKLPWCRLTVSPIDNEPIPSWVASFSRGGSISAEHLVATELTVQRLQAGGVRKMVIHVRDPREAALSMVHFRTQQGKYEGLGSTGIGDPYAGASLDTKFQAECMHFIPFWAKWLRSWVELYDEKSCPFELLFTSYPEFLADETLFLRRILEFYGVDPMHVNLSSDVSAQHKLHFRSGRENEWREMLGKAAQEHAWSLMDKSLCERFGWAP